MTSLNKIWSGETTTDTSTTQGDYSAADNWQPINVRTTNWTWTASASGTNEYYALLSAGNPGISEPGNVQQDGANMTAGTAGSLAAGEWDYADNDTLGYSTIYVRLSDGADPDSKTDGFVTFTQIPAATDDVVIPAGAKAISAGLVQSSVAIGDFRVEPGFTAGIGTPTQYLEIDPDSFQFNASGNNAAYIDIGSTNISCFVYNTPQPSGSVQHGLFLLGSNIDDLEVRGGNVGVGVQFNETATVAEIRQSGGTVTVGPGVSLTNHWQRGGVATLVLGNTLTALNFDGGQLTTEGTAAITTATLDKAGIWNHNSTGTVTTLNQNGEQSLVDMLQSGQARTITTYNFYGGTRKYDPAVVTITTRSAPNVPVTETATRA